MEKNNTTSKTSELVLILPFKDQYHDSLERLHVLIHHPATYALFPTTSCSCCKLANLFLDFGRFHELLSRCFHNPRPSLLIVVVHKIIG